MLFFVLNQYILGFGDGQCIVIDNDDAKHLTGDVA